MPSRTRSAGGPPDPAAAPTPTVSVVIPTYDSLGLLREALAALVAQSLPGPEIEVLVVDDGSTDDTWAFLQDPPAGEVPTRLRSFRQLHTGRAGPGRNLGLRHARGRYVFFHDADDYLAPDALRRLVELAERDRADVVVGRVLQVGTTAKPRPDRNATDADLLADGVWRTLSPHKLFRRTLLDRLGVEFPEDMAQAEDQVFVATCLFAAHRVSVLGDYTCYFRRRRSDGRNLSRQPQTLENKRLTATRMTALVLAHSEPGRRRSALLRRIMVGSLAPALTRPFLEADPAERHRFLTELRQLVLPYLDAQHLAAAPPFARMRLVTATVGTAEQLVALNRTLKDRPAVRAEQGRFAYDLGPELNALIPAEHRAADPPALDVRVAGCTPAADGYRLTFILCSRPLPADRVQLLGSVSGGPSYVLDDATVEGGEAMLTVRPDQLPGRPERVGGAPGRAAWAWLARRRRRTTWALTVRASAGGVPLGARPLLCPSAEISTDCGTSPGWRLDPRP